MKKLLLALLLLPNLAFAQQRSEPVMKVFINFLQSGMGVVLMLVLFVSGWSLLQKNENRTLGIIFLIILFLLMVIRVAVKIFDLY